LEPMEGMAVSGSISTPPRLRSQSTNAPRTASVPATVG